MSKSKTKLTATQRTIRKTLLDYSSWFLGIMHQYEKIMDRMWIKNKAKKASRLKPDTMPDLKHLLDLSIEKQEECNSFCMSNQKEITEKQAHVGVVLLNIFEATSKVILANLTMLNLYQRGVDGKYVSDKAFTKSGKSLEKRIEERDGMVEEFGKRLNRMRAE